MEEDKEKFEEIKQHYEFITTGLEEKTKFIDISILEYLEKLIQITENLIVKNKELEQENNFLKMMYRGTQEFKNIEKLANS